MSEKPPSRLDAEVTVTDRASTVTYAVVSWYPSESDCRADSMTHRVPGPSVRGTVFTVHSSAPAGPPARARARMAAPTIRPPAIRELPCIDIRPKPVRLV